MHESQSRLFENHLACSAEFWHALTPALARELPSLARADADELLRAVNRPNSCANHQSADELSCPLHIVVRYELERTVFDGTMRVADLEDAWRATYEEYLGVTPADAREGVLQDVHWASGYVGYFPSYVLGDMYTAQIFDALLADVPDALARLGEGDPSGVCGWLREHVWRYGQTYTAPETLRLATGADQDVDHYLAHLRRRFCRRVRGGAAGAEAGGVPRR